MIKKWQVPVLYMTQITGEYLLAVVTCCHGNKTIATTRDVQNLHMQ